MSSKTKEVVANCTCPNCGKKFILGVFDGHVRECPRKRNRKFPKYLTVRSIPHLGMPEIRTFMSMGEAGVLFDSGMMKVEIEALVLESDFTVRLLSKAEGALISALADANSDNK